MPIYLDTLNKILSLGTIFLQIFFLVIIVNLILFRYKRNNIILSFVNKYTMLFGFIVSLMSILLSLFYSEIIGFPPCELCWIQRIFLYPQLVLFGLGLYKKEKSSLDASLILAIFGSITSIYHIYIENGGSGISCANPLQNPGQVSCAIRYVYEFGYITIPVMCLTLSLFIIAIILNRKYFLKTRTSVI